MAAHVAGGALRIAESPASMRQRVGTNLDVDGKRRHALAALLEPWRPIALRRPQTPALPTGLRIVDACVETLGIEAERIGHPQRHHFAVDQRREASFSLAVEIGTSL